MGLAFSSEKLQEKGNRAYFQITSKLNKGDIYFSPIDLNQEHGAVSLPYTPTIRAATPLFNNNDQLLGIVIINVNLNSFFGQIRSLVSSKHTLYIHEQNTQFILHPKSEKQFANQLNHENTFEKEFEETELFNTKFYSLKKTSNNSLLLAHSLDIVEFNREQNLSIVLTTPQLAILENAQNIRKEITYKTAIDQLKYSSIHARLKGRESLDIGPNYYANLASINYLNNELSGIKVKAMETVFYQLIEEQTKNMMLISVKPEYVLKTIDPPQVPEERAKPNRALIVILGTILGGMLSIFIVLLQRRNTK